MISTGLLTLLSLGMNRNSLLIVAFLISIVADDLSLLCLLLGTMFRNSQAFVLITCLTAFALITNSVPLVVVVMFASFATFLGMVSVSGFTAMAYALSSMSISLVGILTGNVQQLLAILTVLTLAFTNVAYLRQTMVGFSTTLAAVLLIVHKLALLALTLVYAIKVSLLLQVFVLLNVVLTIAFMADKQLLLLNSTMTVLIIGNMVLDLTDIVAAFLAVYVAQSCLLLFSVTSNNVIVSTLLAVFVFGIPVTVVNVVKLLVLAVSDTLDLVVLLCTYVATV